MPASTCAPACFSAGGWLARDHALIDVGGGGTHEALGRYDFAIDGDFLAGAHLQHIADLDRREGHFLQFAVAEDAGRLGLHSHELADGRGRAVFGFLFEQPTREDEGDNHHRGVEIGGRIHSAHAPNLFAPKGVEGGEEEGNGGGEGYEGVHVGGLVEQLAPGGDVEAASAEDEVGQGKQQGGLVGEGGAAQTDPAHGDSHREEGEEPGQERAAAESDVGAALDGLHAAVGFDDKVETNAVDGCLHLFERDGRRVVVDESGAACERHGGRLDATEAVERALHVG